MKSQTLRFFLIVTVVLFLCTLTGNLLLYAWEGISKTELYVLDTTSLRIHLWTWIVCFLSGTMYLILRTGRRILILLPVAWLLVFLALLPILRFTVGYRYFREPQAYTSPDGRQCVLIVYEGEIYRKESALFIRKMCDLKYPFSMNFKEGTAFDERYKINWLDDRAVIACQNPEGGETPVLVSVPLD